MIFNIILGRHGWGPMYLYFGCRHAHLDNIYRDETSQMEAEGVLTTVYTALSRTRGQPKVKYALSAFWGGFSEI